MIIDVKELSELDTDLARQQWLLDSGLSLDEIDAVIEYNLEQV